MIVLAGAALSIAVFTGAIIALRLPALGARAISSAQAAVQAIRDADLTDDEREKHVQGASIELLGLFLSIVIRSLLALFLAFCPIWLLDRVGLTTVSSILGYLARWDVIVVSTLVITLGFVLWQRSRKSQ